MIRLSYPILLADVSQFGHFYFLTLENQTKAFGHPFYDIFVPQKVSRSEISDDVIACNLLFGPLLSQSKIVATHMLKLEFFFARYFLRNF